MDQLIEFVELTNQEPEEISNPRTLNDWWEEFKMYIEG